MPQILIIDDDEQTRYTLREIMEREGFNVLVAENGNIGIKLFRENPADLIITDILMPEKEGLETINELKREYPDVKIIAISGGGGPTAMDFLPAAKLLGAARTFSKPVDRHELVQVVREVLGEDL